MHNSNLQTVGTQAAVLAGLDITMFIEFSPPDDNLWGEHVVVARGLKVIYYGMILGAFCANMIVVSQTTALSVLGAGLALRGPDGSMMTATDGLYEERRSVFRVFGFGLAMTISSVLALVWLMLRVEAAVVCWIATLITVRRIYLNFKRVQMKFEFDERDTVDFTDIFDGPAAIKLLPRAVAKLGRRGINGAKQVFVGHGDKQNEDEDLSTDAEMEEGLIHQQDVKRRSGYNKKNTM